MMPPLTSCHTLECRGTCTHGCGKRSKEVLVPLLENPRYSKVALSVDRSALATIASLILQQGRTEQT